MFNKILIVTLFTVFCGALSAQQSTVNEEQKVEQKTASLILEGLKAARPDLSYDEVRPSPIDGLYQVQVQGGPVLYVTSDGTKMVVGELLSISSRGFAPVEDPYVVKKRKEVLAELDPGKAITYTPDGETKAVVYVFTDVDCGYCRQLHSQLHSYNDEGQAKPGYLDLGIEVRYLAFPRAGIPSSSADKLFTAWCSDNSQEVLNRLKNLQTVPTKSCEQNPVAEQYRLAQEIGVRGTPGLLLPDGRLVAGYLPPEDLARALGLKTTP